MQHASSGRINLSHHVVNEAVLIPDTRLLKLVLVMRLIHLCKDLEETTIIYLQYGVLGRHIQWPAAHASAPCFVSAF